MAIAYMVAKFLTFLRQALVIVLLLLVSMQPTRSSSTTRPPVVASAALALPGCRSQCGGVVIPYPFGTTGKCAMNSRFRIKCPDNNGLPILGKNITVKSISVDRNSATIMWSVARDCYHRNGTRKSRLRPRLMLSTAVTVSDSRNKFTVIGCDSYAFLRGYKDGMNYSMGCMSVCNSKDDVPTDGSCSGIGCCQIDIPRGLKNVTISPRTFNNHTKVADFNPCTYAFVSEDHESNRFRFSPEYLGNFTPKLLPLVVDWEINVNDSCRRNSSLCATCGKENTQQQFTSDRLGYTCKCNNGYQGNPYLPDGCQIDIDECEDKALHNCTKHEYCENTRGGYICKERSRQLPLIKITIGTAIGFIALLISGSWLYLVLKKRKMIQLKEKLFRQNGGLILQQKLSKNHDMNSSNEMAKIFTEEELKKATLNYDDTTVIGRGGFGTVYKGFLPDNRIVAIKKSKLVDRNQTEQFINEVVVLSQINHRNVVKLLGCCLETEVPLLVYEFVPNGTLSEHIHDKEKSSRLGWEIRLRIAAETAETLSYLHSAASTPIIHRDVKPSNILLDNYTAKVSDFGASRLVPLDQTELATMVQGTLGYLDPEYLHTNQLTEKSDVYSFGVVLVELLTGKKAICFERPEAERSLAMYFLSSLKRDRLFEMVETGLVKEEIARNREQVEKVANVAKRCLNVNGEERPTMKEVAMELEGLRRRMEKHPWANEELVKFEESEYLLAHETSIPYEDMSEANNANILPYDSIRSDHVILDFSGR